YNKDVFKFISNKLQEAQDNMEEGMILADVNNAAGSRPDIDIIGGIFNEKDIHNLYALIERASSDIFPADRQKLQLELDLLYSYIVNNFPDGQSMDLYKIMEKAAEIMPEKSSSADMAEVVLLLLEKYPEISADRKSFEAEVEKRKQELGRMARQIELEPELFTIEALKNKDVKNLLKIVHDRFGKQISDTEIIKIVLILIDEGASFYISLDSLDYGGSKDFLTGAAAEISSDDSLNVNQNKFYNFAKKVFALPFLLYTTISEKFKSSDAKTKVFLACLNESSADLISVMKTEDGKIIVPAVIINQMPKNFQNYNFKNTGIKINGEYVWIGSYFGSLTAFAKGQEIANIRAALSENSKKFSKALASYINRTAGTKINASGVFDIETIDVNLYEEDGKKPAMDYGKNAELRVFLPADAGFIDSGLINFIAASAEVKRADTLAAIESIYYRLDNIKTLSDLNSCIADMKNINNGQFIFEYALLQSLPDGKRNQFFQEAHAAGIKIMADVSDIPAEKLIAEGFDGRVSQKDGKLYVEDFILGSSLEAGLVDGYADLAGLSNILANTKGIKIVSGTKLIDVLAGQDRSIVDRLDILKLIKSGRLLGVLKQDLNSEEFLRNAAYSIDEKYLPEVDASKIEILVSFLKDGQIAQALEILNLRQSNPFMLRLNSIEEAPAKTAFLQAVTERILARQNLTASLENKTLEKVLGKALRLQAQSGNAAKNDWAIGEKYKEEHKGFTQSDLKKEVSKYTSAAFENNDPQALKAIVELIMVCASERRNFDAQDAGTSIRLDGIRQILSAA
ncbi:MAG: hypothetical protein LBQ47_08510, partial [Endomicrobium sp.]|nr:hypothetical protein [Endomicrobium sp.]